MRIKTWRKSQKKQARKLFGLVSVCFVFVASFIGLIHVQWDHILHVFALTSVSLNGGTTTLESYVDLTSSTVGLGADTGAYTWTVDGGNYMVLNIPFNPGLTQNDYSGESNDGTNVDSPVYQLPTSGECKVGGCLEFDGSTSYVSLSPSSFDPATSPAGFTVSAWANADDLFYGGANQARPIIYKRKFNGVSFAPQFALLMDGRFSEDKVAFFLGTGDGASDYTAITSSNNSISTGAWYHVVGVYDPVSQNIFLYLDGVLVAQQPHTAIPSTSTFDIQIGRSTATPDFFDGKIDEVQIFDRPLSANQIALLYSNGNSGNGGPTTIVDDETITGQVWDLAITPFDASGTTDTPVASGNTVTIAAPSISTQLNSGVSSLSTYVDLESQVTGLGTPEAAYTWTVDGGSLMVLNIPFNAGGGQTDYSGEGNNGTVGGGASFHNEGCKVGGCYEFDGVIGDQVTIPDDDSLDITGAFTISAWIKSDVTINSGAGDSATIAVKGQNGGSESTMTYGMWIRGEPFTSNKGKVEIKFSDGTFTPNFFTDQAEILADTWYHIVGTWDGTDNTGFNIYINGVDQSGTIGPENASSIKVSTDTFSIGASSNGQRPFDGLIDEVQVFDRALSPSQVIQMYNNGNADLAGPTIITDEETTSGEVWDLDITPFDSDGNPLSVVNSSNTVTISSPTVTVGLNNGVTTQDTALSITSQVTGLSDPQGAYQWEIDGSDLLLLNLPFNTSGAQTDYSGNTNDGVIEGTPVFYSADSPNCKVGGCLEINSNDDAVSIPNSASLNPSGSFTVSAWVYAESFPNAEPYVVQKTNGAGNQYLLSVLNSGEANCDFNIDATPTTTSGGTINLGQWHHIACVYNELNLILYVDGVRIASTNNPGSVTSSTGVINIGKEVGTTTQQFDGFIDEVHIFDRALGAGQVSQIYNDGNVGNAGPTEIVASETEIGDVWGLGVVPFDSNGDALTLVTSSNTVTVDEPYTIELAGGVASQASVIDLETEITFDQATTGFNGDDQGAYVWEVDGVSPQVINIPFNSGLSFTRAYNYAREEQMTFSSGMTLLTDGGGIAGPYASFDGVDDLTRIDNASLFTALTALNEGSISFWYKSSDTTTDPEVVYTMVRTGQTGDVVDVIVGDTGSIAGATTQESLTFRVRRSNADQLILSTTGGTDRLKDEQWHHIVIATGGGDNRIYIDGQQEDVTFSAGGAATAEFSNINSPSHISFFFQRIGSVGTFYSGFLDEFQLWDRAITDDQIAILYEEGLANTSSPSVLSSTELSAGESINVNLYRIPLTESPTFLQIPSNTVALTLASGDLCGQLGDGGVVTAVNTSFDNTDVFVSDCTISIDGAHTFDSLTVKSGGVLTHSQSTTDKTILTIEGNILVTSNSQINLDGKGYLGGRSGTNTSLDGDGPGGGIGAAVAGCAGCAGGGGGYGGQGGDAAVRDVFTPRLAGDPGNSYETFDTFSDFGSGGGAGKNSSEAGEGDGGNGGGFIEITCSTCTNTITIEGAFTANGGAGDSFARKSGGGGAGGGISLRAGTIEGSGSLTANGGFPAGGVGGTNTGGNGGGGRIKIETESLVYADTLTTQVISGTSDRAGYGGAGSIYIVNPDSSSELRINANNLDVEDGINALTGLTQPITYDRENLHVITNQMDGVDLVITNDSVATIQASISNGDITINSGELISETVDTLSSDIVSITNSSILDVHSRVDGVNDYALNLEIGSSLNLDVSSSITATGRGFRGGQVNGQGNAGEGTGGGGEAASGDDRIGAGGSHGGQGTEGLKDSVNTGSLGLIGSSYGNLLNPLTFGSGGGSGNDATSPGGNGGGLIRITCGSPCTSALTINGAISSNGTDGEGANRDQGGGGAGGSLQITANTITGTGSLSANGGIGSGSASSNTGGSGGGGRIFVNVNSGSLPGTISVDTLPGSGSLADPAAAGTVYLIENGESTGDVIIDNNNLDSPNFTPLITSDGPSSVIVDTLFVQNEADLLIDTPCSGTVLTVQEEIQLSNNGIITNNQAGTCFVDNDLAIVPTTLPVGSLNQAYSESLSFSGGFAPRSLVCLDGPGGSVVTCNNASAGLPVGLTMNGSGVVSGTPTVAGSYQFTVQLTDSNPAGASSIEETITLFISQPPNIPVLISLTDASTVSSTTPTLSALYSDDDAGDIGVTEYRVSNASAADCLSGGPGVVWSGSSALTSTASEATSVVVGIALTNTTTYFWCARNNDGASLSDSANYTSMGSFYVDTDFSPGGGLGTILGNQGGGGGDAEPSPEVEIEDTINSYSMDLSFVDVNGDKLSDIIEPNELLFGTLVMTNTNDIAAFEVFMNLPLSGQIQYIPGSLQINTISQSDTADQDRGQANQNAISAIWPQISAGQTKTITFQLVFTKELTEQAQASTLVELQASVSASNAENTFLSNLIVLNSGNDEPEEVVESEEPTEESQDQEDEETNMGQDPDSNPQPEIETNQPSQPEPGPSPITQPVTETPSNPLSPVIPLVPIDSPNPEGDNQGFNQAENISNENQPLFLTGSVQSQNEQLQFSGTVNQPNAEVVVTINGQVFTLTTDANGFWQTFVNAQDLGIAEGQSSQVSVEAFARVDGEESNRITRQIFVERISESLIINEVKEEVSSNTVVRSITQLTSQAQEIIEEQEEEIQATLTVVAPVVAVASVPIWGYLPYVPTMLFHMISWILGLFGRKKTDDERFFGIVYDSISKEPVSLAIVRIYKLIDGEPGVHDNHSRQLVKTVVTDKEGRYEALLEPGQYELEVKKPQFSFPSKIVTSKTDGQYTNIYSGILNLQPSTSQPETIPDIPLDPENAPKKWQTANLVNKLWMTIQNVAQHLAVPILFIGAGAGIVVLVNDPSNPINWILSILYILMLAMQITFRMHPAKAWGMVYDVSTNAALPLTTLQLIDPEFGKVVKTRLSDYEGRFSFLPEPGKYVVKANKEGYMQADVVEARKGRNPLQGEVTIEKEGERIDGDIAMKNV